MFTEFTCGIDPGDVWQFARFHIRIELHPGYDIGTVFQRGNVIKVIKRWIAETYPRQTSLCKMAGNEDILNGA